MAVITPENTTLTKTGGTMKFDKEKFMKSLRAKLPNSDVFELTMRQKTAALNHLKAVNSRYSHAKGRTFINLDYMPRIEAMDAKKGHESVTKKAVAAFGLFAVLVVGIETTMNQSMASKKPSMIAADVDKNLISPDLKSYDEKLAVAPIEEGDVQ
jgi:hypothetical protein